MILINCTIELNPGGFVSIRADGKPILHRHVQELPVEMRNLVKAALEAKVENLDPIELAGLDPSFR